MDKHNIKRIESNPLRVLSIEDDPVFAMVLERTLRRIPDLSMDFQTVADPDLVIDLLADTPVDILFLDYQLGKVTGAEVLRKIRKAGHLHPIIMLTAHGTEYIAAEATRIGADDYIVKSDLNPDLLNNTILRAYMQHDIRLVQEQLSERTEALERMSQRLVELNTELIQANRKDHLTGLFNRRTMEELIDMEHKRSTRYRHSYSVVMIDVDYFKQFNDTAGHQAGDLCLQSIADCLRDASRATDLVCRYGGEELLILAPETQEQGALVLAERARQAVQARQIDHPGLETEDGVVTISVGVAVGPDPNWEAVVRQADDALYRAKREGRNRVCLAASENQPDAIAEYAPSPTAE